MLVKVHVGMFLLENNLANVSKILNMFTYFRSVFPFLIIYPKVLDIKMFTEESFITQKVRTNLYIH